MTPLAVPFSSYHLDLWIKIKYHLGDLSTTWVALTVSEAIRPCLDVIIGCSLCVCFKSQHKFEDFSVFKSFDSRWERMTQISGQLHNLLRRALTFRFPFKRNRASSMASKDFHSFTVWRVTLSKNELCILLQWLSGPQVSQQQTMTHASNKRAPLW